MEDVDYTSCKQVAEIITQSQLCKFIVYRVGQSRKSVPVFECLDTTTHKAARDAFLSWARITNNHTVYDMVLTNSKGGEDEDNAKGKSKSVRFSFMNKEAPVSTHTPVHMMQAPQQENISEVVENMFAKYTKQQEENKVLQAIEGLSDRLSDLEEDDDPEPEERGSMNKLEDAITTVAIAQINKWDDTSINGNRPDIQKGQVGQDRNIQQGQTSQPAVNGVAEATKLLNDPKLQQALVILQKNDDDIVNDLVRLANLSQKQNDLFQYMIKNLRSLSK